jgi:phytoene dehydrogenase-like protein
LLDVTPRQFLAIAGDRLEGGYRRALQRFRYAPGAYKMDWALDGPIPWRDPACQGALTVHVGGTLEAIADAEPDVARGRHPGRPFVLLVQPTIADPTRAPQGKHTAWAYCHVPNRSTVDMSDRIERQIERFAPGFRDRSSRAQCTRLRTSSAWTPIASVVTSAAVCRTCVKSSRVPRCESTRTARRSPAYSSARRQRHPVAVCME